MFKTTRPLILVTTLTSEKLSTPKSNINNATKNTIKCSMKTSMLYAPSSKMMLVTGKTHCFLMVALLFKLLVVHYCHDIALALPVFKSTPMSWPVSAYSV